MLHVHHYTYERLGCERDEDLVTLCETCHSELHRLIADPPNIPFLYKCGVGGVVALLGTIGIEGFLQAPLPAEIGVLIVAYLLAKNSPTVYARLKGMLPAEVMAWLGKPPEAGKRSTLDIWLGRKEKRAPQERDTTGEDEGSDEQIAAYLRQNGLSPETITDWMGSHDADLEDDEADPLDEIEMDDAAPSFQERQTDIFRFSELLRTGWRPSWRQIFVGRTMEGKDIFVAAEDLCHVAIAGKTGGGKGSLMRLIMVQLCSIGASVTLLNPHYMRWVRAKEGEEFDEDWSPFEGTNQRTGKPYLEISPLEGAEFRTIFEYLEWAVEKLLEKRKLEGRTKGIRFRPYFIVIDEWPSIAGKLGKGAPKRLGELLREGRKFGINVMIASQDFQVKTIGVEGEGGVRKCLLTVFYTGGDQTTARELLYPKDSNVTIPETKLGKGMIMMRCTGTENKAILARVPFVDNESVYLLLGPSTFRKKSVTEREAEATKETIQIDGARPEARTLTLETITSWFDTGRINEKQFFALLSQLVGEDEPQETDELEDPSFGDKAEALPEKKNPSPDEEAELAPAEQREQNQRKLTHLHRQVLEHYRSGLGYRHLGELIGVGKDKAGELVKDLKKWGFLKEGPSE
jgi:hypothetical protein